MVNYNGTNEDDVIDVSTLDSNVERIYPGEGNDTVTNLGSQHFVVTSPGEDTISGSNFHYAFFDSQQAATINLKEGWSEDGFGTRDTVSGVKTVHGTRFGDTFYGTDDFEEFFVNGGNNILNMGIGDDKIMYTSSRGDSSDFSITKLEMKYI